MNLIREAAVALSIILVNSPNTLVGTLAQAEDSPVPKRIALEVLEPPDRPVLHEVPIAVGVVLPRGALGASESVRVVDNRAANVPVDTEVTAWWEPDRQSVKWLLLKFPVTTDRKYFFEYPAKPAASPQRPIATRDDRAITVNTGPLQAEFRESAGLFSRLALSGREILGAETQPHRLVFDCRDVTAELEEMNWEIEETTHWRATIRGRGFFATPWAKRAAQLDLRIQFFRNESFVRLYHTLIWLNREYDPDLGNFRSPGIYLSGELVQQSRLWPDDERLSEVLLEYLQHQGFPDIPDGGVRFTNRVMLCGAAGRLSADRRYAEVAFYVARTLADLVPDVEESQDLSPELPLSGNGYFRWWLGPILVGLAQGRSLDLRNDQPHLSHDTHIGFPVVDEPQVYFQPNRDGTLHVRVFLRAAWDGGFPAVRISVVGATSQPDEIVVSGTSGPAPVDRVASLDRRWRSATFAVQNAEEGKTYALKFDGGDATVAALVLADAKIVHRLKPGQPAALQNHAGQYHSGGRVFLKTSDDVVKISNGRKLPFSIRDAQTWELLYVSPLPVPAETRHELGKDRLIAVVVASSRNLLDVRSGVHPWAAANRESWFAPTVLGEPR
jgi:hypothetical protein